VTPAERSLRARMAAHAMHAKYGTSGSRRLARTGQDGLRARFERDVDPRGELPAEERRRRAEHLYRAHMARLTMLSIKARRRNAGGEEVAG